jgi:hypothetical protein
VARRLHIISDVLDVLSAPRVIRVALLGEADEPLRRLLEDVLRDGVGGCELVPAHDTVADAAVVMVTWGEEARTIAAARAEAADVPLLAILPFGDDRLVALVLSCGARAWYGLDSPLALLRSRLVALAGREAPAEAKSA